MYFTSLGWFAHFLSYTQHAKEQQRLIQKVLGEHGPTHPSNLPTPPGSLVCSLGQPRIHYGVQSGLQLADNLLPLPPKSWSYKRTAHLALVSVSLLPPFWTWPPCKEPPDHILCFLDLGSVEEWNSYFQAQFLWTHRNYSDIYFRFNFCVFLKSIKLCCHVTDS